MLSWRVHTPFMRTVSLFLVSISPRTCLFFSTLLAGVLLRVSSDSWFGAWCGLELNLMSFIPYVSTKESVYSSEAALKYFLIQALGSSFIIMGAVELVFFVDFGCLLLVALLLKLGAAPMHFWFPQVIGGLTWLQCVVLMTVQKVGPMFLLSYVLVRESACLVVYGRAILSAVVGALGGINQILLRKLLAFSSINHIS